MPKLSRYRRNQDDVWALRIAKIIPLVDEIDGEHVLAPEEPGALGVKVSDAYMKKFTPEVGGYYVDHGNGHEVYSAAEVFEAGYTKL